MSIFSKNINTESMLFNSHERTAKPREFKHISYVYRVQKFLLSFHHRPNASNETAVTEHTGKLYSRTKEGVNLASSSGILLGEKFSFRHFQAHLRVTVTPYRKRFEAVKNYKIDR